MYNETINTVNAHKKEDGSLVWFEGEWWINYIPKYNLSFQTNLSKCCSHFTEPGLVSKQMAYLILYDIYYKNSCNCKIIVVFV